MSEVRVVRLPEVLVLDRQAARLAAQVFTLALQMSESRDGVKLPEPALHMLAELRVFGGLDPDPTDVRVSASVVDEAPLSLSTHDLLDSSAAAELLDCTPANVRDLRRRRRLNAVRIGAQWMFERAAVLDLLDERGQRRAG